jgi:hypothetical protein
MVGLAMALGILKKLDGRQGCLLQASSSVV